MRTIGKILALAAAVAAMATSSATALSGPYMFTSRSPLGTASNTAAIAGSTGPDLNSPTFTINSVTVGCSTVVARVTAPTTTAVSFRPAFSGCTAFVSGAPVAAVTVDVNCEWTATFANSQYSTGTGSGPAGTIDLPCPTTFTAPSVGCTIHLSAATSRIGVAAQNSTSSGTSDTSASPWGSVLNANVSGLHFTTTIQPGGTCLVPATSFGFFRLQMYAPQLWGML